MCTRQKNLEDAQIPQTNFEEPIGALMHIGQAAEFDLNLQIR